MTEQLDPGTAARLQQLTDTWWQAVGDFADLLDGLAPEDGSVPTDLPGWDVHDVAAHVAHLEHLSVGGDHDDVPGIEIGSPAHVGSPMSVFTEQGVVARREVPIAELAASIRRDTAVRREQLATLPDPAAPADGMFGLIGWTWETLLKNRPLDVWMHEQDIRRALARPGHLDRAAGAHVVDYLGDAFGYVVGKKVRPATGTTAVLAVDDSERAVEIGADGRGRRLPEPPPEPTVRLAMDRETFIVLAGGRRGPDQVAPDAVRVTGDAELGARIVEQLGTTP